MSETTANQRVWNRRHETEETFVNPETLAPQQKFNASKLAKIAEQEGTTLLDFLAYAKNRQQGIEE